MSDRDIIPIGSLDHTDDQADIAARVAALYAQTPTADADQVERCVRAVRTRSMHQPTRSRLGIVGPRWWWGAAAAAVLITATTRPWRGSVATREADSAFADAAALAVQSAAAESLSATATATATDAVALRGSITRVNGSNIEFDLQLPTSAKAVAIVGDFNDWDQHATPMAKRAADGTWSARVPLAPGRHTYAFVVDGERWIVDPLAPQVPGDGYGPANAVVIDAPTR